MRFVLAVLVFALLAGCGRRETELSTGKIVASISLPTAFKPGHFAASSEYAVVQSSALPAMYQDFRATLSDLGLVKWDNRFDCSRFSTLYIGIAQARYAVAAWHSSSKAKALALAEVWYLQGGDVNRGHSIVLAHTERGPVFIEPQTGAEVSLTPAEQGTIFMVKW